MDKTKIKIGDFRYINKNCWLANNVGYPPSKRCRYCVSKFNKCLFFQYLVISVVLVLALIGLSFLIEGEISKLLIVSIFGLIVIYGYFFNQSTEKIIEANFAEKKAKESLEELAEGLEDQVAQRTKELREAYSKLEKLDEAKNQFLMATQHHLRTPLTSMMGYSDLIAGGSYGKINKKTKEVIKKFQSLTQGLIKMVNDFLDITQFKMGKSIVSLKKDIDITPVVEEIIEELKLEADTKGISLKLVKRGESKKISADPEKLKVALFNIIDNAIKYTIKGEVVVTVENNSPLRIIVADTGIGFSPENAKQIFNKTFERGETAKKMFVTGRGIGLYISSRIIEEHGGTIWAESSGEGKGSKFYIDLPIK